MENLFKELAWKCHENELDIDYSNQIGAIHVYVNKVDDPLTTVTRGYIKNWKWEKPVETLERMHQEVDRFIEKEPMNDMENVYFERPRGVSSGEMKMKESGHKISDFE